MRWSKTVICLTGDGAVTVASVALAAILLEAVLASFAPVASLLVDFVVSGVAKQAVDVSLGSAASAVEVGGLLADVAPREKHCVAAVDLGSVQVVLGVVLSPLVVEAAVVEMSLAESVPPSNFHPVVAVWQSVSEVME